MSHFILMLLSVVLIYFLLYLYYPYFLLFLCSYSVFPRSLHVTFVCNTVKIAVPGAFPPQKITNHQQCEFNTKEGLILPFSYLPLGGQMTGKV